MKKFSNIVLTNQSQSYFFLGLPYFVDWARAFVYIVVYVLTDIKPSYPTVTRDLKNVTIIGIELPSFS